MIIVSHASKYGLLWTMQHILALCWHGIVAQPNSSQAGHCCPHADLSGGFQLLFDAYSNFVAVNVKSVLTLHILLFVLTIILMGSYVFFMVLPFVKMTNFETRRIAELMSQLPAEVGWE
jgi:hypothetical protein